MKKKYLLICILSSFPIICGWKVALAATTMLDRIECDQLNERAEQNTSSQARDLSNASGLLTCSFTLTPDLNLINSSTEIEAEINQAVARFSDDFLGTGPPSAADVADAESQYADLGISLNNGVPSGNSIASLTELKFLRIFAKHLKFNPSDANIKNKVNNTVWWASLEICSENLNVDPRGYEYRHFARPVIFMKDFLTSEVQELFRYTLFKTTNDFEHYWEANYDANHQRLNGAIDTDQIYNKSSTLMAYSLWHDTAEERYRYMRGFKRYMERFFSYTVGTTNGIKPDGSSFHHWTAYNNYMYAFRTAINNLSYLDGTRFQVDEVPYKVFRDAVLVQRLQANDFGLQALSTSGRKPNNREAQTGQEFLKSLAISGGKILGLDSADPVLAGFYNRVYGIDFAFNYSTIAPFENGFTQLNHSSAGFFRHENWVAFTKGFTDGLWGTEAYKKSNRYGRYQSYGALEILYPGDESDNGYHHETWNWNYNPGTTVIRLPWSKLHAERERVDELQEKGFAGALTFKKKQGDFLSENYGDIGLFAMDFREREDLGFGTTHSSNNHNSSFTFKKSNFFFDDLIVCLGSGISNDDPTNNTITTLFQRLDNNSNGTLVNAATQSAQGEMSFNGSTNNWLLSNYGTGFYLLPDNHSLKVKKEVQQNPNHDQIWPASYTNNLSETYYTGYIDHGTKPTNESYEYILKPNTSSTELQQLDAAINAGNKPYTVHQQNENAHILEHKDKSVFGYAVFSSVGDLDFGEVKSIQQSCLLMSEYDSSTGNLRLALTNPDLGFSSRSFEPAVSKVVKVSLIGQWEMLEEQAAVQIVSSNSSETLIEFTTVDGLALELVLSRMPVSTQEIVGNSFMVNIYPNPTQNRIEVVSDQPIQDVKVYDLSGREVKMVSPSEGSQQYTLELDLPALSQSVYFIKVKTKAGERTKQVFIK